MPTSRHSEVKPPPSPGIVLIERTRRPDDPWSGQIALPGGRHHGEDRDPEETARRETREELGISLGRALGVLDDLPVHTGPATVVTPHVFHLESLPPLALDGREVASAWLAPIPELADPARRTTHHWQRGAERLDLPAIEVRLPESRTLAPGALSGETSHVLWGLTYRTVQGFLARCGAWPVPQTRP